jgi:predicted DNA-binding protein with PD1-like motif
VFTYPSDDGRAAFVRLPRGVDLLESLNEAAVELGIEAGTLQIVGAVEELTVAYYRQDTQAYEPHRYTEAMEISGGVGNVSIKDGAPFVHIHVTGSRRDGSAVGGHLFEAHVGATLELFVLRFDGELRRTLDEATGAALLDL